MKVEQGRVCIVFCIQIQEGLTRLELELCSISINSTYHRMQRIVTILLE